MNFNYLNKGKILKILDKKITKISFIIIIIIISLLVLVTYTNSQNNIQISNTENNTYADIDNFIKEKITSSGIPGLAIGIVHNNKVIYLKGYGTADVSGRKVTPQTPFIIGSATKSFTALSILQLAQQNKISLDAPVQKYIPYFKVDDQTASSKITIRQLLNQTSGLETKTGYVGNFSNNTTLEQRVRQLSDIKIMNQPGSTFAYCNENYAVLGLVIEKISGKSYGNFVATNTFEPLEMINSYTDIDIAINNGISDGHQSFFGVPITTKPNYPKYLISDGYIITSAQDMTKYLIMNMNNGEYNNTSILSPKLHAELFKPSTSDNYGMGWFNDSSYGIKTLNHGGDVKNFHTEMLIDKKTIMD